MFGQLEIDKNGPLTVEINRLLSDMSNEKTDSEEYLTLLARVERLMKLRAEVRPERINRDTMAIVVGNLIGVVLIVAYEQKHAISARGITQLIKPRPV